MAEAQKYPFNLYDANGNQVGELEHDVDMSGAATRDGVIRNGGKVYVWNQRNSQWREASQVYEVKGKAEAPDEEPAATPAKK